MSKLSDYNKFDHLDDADSDSEEKRKTKSNTNSLQEQRQLHDLVDIDPPQQQHHQKPQQQKIVHATQGSKRVAMLEKKGEPGRYVFQYDGETIYEWEQSLEEVTIYVKVPPFVTKASQLVCHIQTNQLQIGLEGSDCFFITDQTFGKVNTTESSWYLDADEGMLNVILGKVHRGETWDSALRGLAHTQENPVFKQEIKKQLMLERFQEEHPGMDFRDADFNGAVPDPRTFMGGVKYH